MSKESAGEVGELAVRAILSEIKGKTISGFIRSKNICYYNRNFQIDFLVLAPKIGLVVIEVKNWKGKIKTSADEVWTQEINGYTNELNNASLQVLRTSGMLLQILEKGKINKWPIRPLVVFTNDQAEILKSREEINPPQTDIILKTAIPKWIKENTLDGYNYSFKEADQKAIINVICEYTKPYISKKQ